MMNGLINEPGEMKEKTQVLLLRLLHHLPLVMRTATEIKEGDLVVGWHQKAPLINGHGKVIERTYPSEDKKLQESLIMMTIMKVLFHQDQLITKVLSQDRNEKHLQVVVV
jgi:hypothetical protein